MMFVTAGVFVVASARAHSRAPDPHRAPKGSGHKRTGVGPTELLIFTQDSGTGSTPSVPYCSALVARATTTD